MRWAAAASIVTATAAVRSLRSMPFPETKLDDVGVSVIMQKTARLPRASPREDERIDLLRKTNIAQEMVGSFARTASDRTTAETIAGVFTRS